MLVIALAMLAILLVSGLLLAYAAFPHRGQDLPRAAWLGDAIARAADAVPVLHDDDEARSSRRG